MSQFSRCGIDIHILADLLRIPDMATLRRLIHRVERLYGKKFSFKNDIRTPFDDRTSDKKLSEKELKNRFNRPKGFITVEGFFEIIMYVMSVHGRLH